MNPTPFFSFVRPLAVVAFGGNALLRPEDDGSHRDEQLGRAREAVRMLIPIIGKGYELIVVHGNGPQVGNILIQAGGGRRPDPSRSRSTSASRRPRARWGSCSSSPSTTSCRAPGSASRSSRS